MNLKQHKMNIAKKIEKEYIVTVDQAFENEVLTKFLKGVQTLEGKAHAKAVRRLSPRRVVIVLETGMKRQIRMMFQAVHIKVTKLVRVRIGTLLGDGLEPGKYKTLNKEDIDALFEAPAYDPKMTTLESRARFKSKNKSDAPKKWARPTSRSHDGIEASDRPKKKTYGRNNDRRTDDRNDRRPATGGPRSHKPSGPRRDGPSSAGPKRYGKQGPNRAGRPSGVRRPSSRPSGNRGANNSSRGRRD